MPCKWGAEKIAFFWRIKVTPPQNMILCLHNQSDDITRGLHIFNAYDSVQASWFHVFAALDQRDEKGHVQKSLYKLGFE